MLETNLKEFDAERKAEYIYLREIVEKIIDKLDLSTQEFQVFKN